MSLLDKAEECVAQSLELLYEGKNAESLAAAIEAAKWVRLIKLLRAGETAPYDL